MTLLDDLRQGALETARALPCPLCSYIQGTTDEATRNALRDAAAGTIGINKLVAILGRHRAPHETPVGRRTVERHRAEEHQP